MSIYIGWKDWGYPRKSCQFQLQLRQILMLRIEEEEEEEEDNIKLRNPLYRRRKHIVVSIPLRSLRNKLSHT
jgi:hypothetical protein